MVLKKMMRREKEANDENPNDDVVVDDNNDNGGGDGDAEEDKDTIVWEWRMLLLPLLPTISATGSNAHDMSLKSSVLRSLSLNFNDKHANKLDSSTSTYDDARMCVLVLAEIVLLLPPLLLLPPFHRLSAA
jgi:hypothetical protein